MNKQLIFITIFVIATTLIGYRYWIANAQQSKTITIGVASGYAPWAMRNEEGELEGFDVDVAVELAHRLNMSLTLVDMSPEMLMASVRAKKIDCMVAPMAITPERESAFNMVHYQGSAARQWPVMMLHDIKMPCVNFEMLTSFQRLCKIGVLSGTKQSDYALGIEGLVVYPYDSMAHLLMALRAHKIDYALIDPDLGRKLLSDNADMKCILVDVPGIYQSSGNGIAINRGSAELSNCISTVIESMKTDGFIANAEKRWSIGRLV